MSKRDDFQKLMAENLALWGARLATVKAKLSTETAAQGKAADAKKLDDLQAKSDAAGARLDALKATRGDHWDVLKLEVAGVWHDLDALMGQVEEAVRVRDDAAKAATSPQSQLAATSVAPAA